jgi:3',5'-cyclic AMP phosphodiesterase CpdA
MVTMTSALKCRRVALSVASLAAFAGALAAQAPAQSDSVTPLVPPRTPFPSENATASVTRFSFIMYGDTRGRHDGSQLQAEHQLVVESMLSTIKKAAATSDPIRFVVQSGDAIQDGSVAAQTNVSYAPLINRLMLDGDVSYFLAVGNHDVGNSVNLADARRVAGLRNYFAANAELIPPEGSPRRLAGYPTYAFGYGNTYFIAVDSDIPDDTTQIAWMRSQLAGVERRRYPNVTVFFHHPPFSSGPHGGATLERQAASIRAKWMPLFHQYHVRLLLTGHEHLFEHWVERYNDASGAHRIDEIVSGGGGAPLYTYRGEPDVRRYVADNAALKVSLDHLARPSSDPGANPFHYVVVHVDGERFNIEVVGVDWGKGFAPYRSSAASLNDPKPDNP